MSIAFQTSHVDWLTGSNRLTAGAQTRSYGAKSVTLVRARLEGAARASAPTHKIFPDLTVQVLTRGRVAGTADLGCGRFSAVSAPGRSAMVTPPDQPCRIVSEITSCETLMVALPWSQVTALTGPSYENTGPDLSPLYSGLCASERMEAILSRLWSDLGQGGVGGRLFADSGVLALVGALLRAASAPAPAPAKGGLTPVQLSRACEVMDASLEDGVGLAELAGAVGLSPSHFSRAFKRSTGASPSAWLLRRRMERAQALLTDRTLSLAEIALAVGFSAQPAFTTAFHRVYGLSPGAWRRARRG